MPLPLLKELKVFQHEIAKMDLSQLMSVDCRMENILLYGRYVKLSREVSQTPWNLGTKKMVSLLLFLSLEGFGPRFDIRKHASSLRF
jgi:tRNA U54 and U55 pseudouridine synthase Pus10